MGMSWRAPELDASHELSTKLLEYGSRGLPVLVNRNALHEEILGTDYPLYVDGDDPVAAIRAALAEPGSFAEAARRCQRAAQDHTFPVVAQWLTVEEDISLSTRTRGVRACPAGPGGVR